MRLEAGDGVNVTRIGDNDGVLAELIELRSHGRSLQDWGRPLSLMRVSSTCHGFSQLAKRLGPALHGLPAHAVAEAR